MTSLFFAVVMTAAAVTDGDGAPAGLSAGQEAQWAWQHLRPVVVTANAPAEHLDGKVRRPLGKKVKRSPGQTAK